MLIKNARVIDPKNHVDKVLDIQISGGKVQQIAADIKADAEEKVIDASGLVAAPGLIDVHVHFRDPGLTEKEDIYTGAKAAARGGFTTVVCMANTKPAVDSEETLRYVINKGKETGVRVLAAAAVTKGLQGDQITEMEKLAKAGAAGFTDDGIPIMDETLLKEAFRKAKSLDLPVSLHEEDPAYIGKPGVNDGKISAAMGIKGASARAEDVMVERDLDLALETGACVNIQHISSRNSVDLVRRAKAKGGDVHAEATPHHFSLTEEAVTVHGTYAKMNPPLRTEEDRQAIIAGLKDGTIDLIATDHAPHTKAEKDKPFTEAPSGITGLETSLALGITNLVKAGHLSILELIDKMAYQPARLYRLDLGTLEPGKPADLVLFDPEEKFIVSGYASKAENTPFTGMELYGKIKQTICNGKIVF